MNPPDQAPVNGDPLQNPTDPEHNSSDPSPLESVLLMLIERLERIEETVDE